MQDGHAAVPVAGPLGTEGLAGAGIPIVAETHFQRQRLADGRFVPDRGVLDLDVEIGQSERHLRTAHLAAVLTSGRDVPADHLRAPAFVMAHRAYLLVDIGVRYRRRQGRIDAVGYGLDSGKTYFIAAVVVRRRKIRQDDFEQSVVRARRQGF